MAEGDGAGRFEMGLDPRAAYPALPIRAGMTKDPLPELATMELDAAQEDTAQEPAPPALQDVFRQAPFERPAGQGLVPAVAVQVVGGKLDRRFEQGPGPERVAALDAALGEEPLLLAFELCVLDPDAELVPRLVAARRQDRRGGPAGAGRRGLPGSTTGAGAGACAPGRPKAGAVEANGGRTGRPGGLDPRWRPGSPGLPADDPPADHGASTRGPRRARRRRLPPALAGSPRCGPPRRDDTSGRRTGLRRANSRGRSGGRSPRPRGGARPRSPSGPAGPGDGRRPRSSVAHRPRACRRRSRRRPGRPGAPPPPGPSSRDRRSRRGRPGTGRDRRSRRRRTVRDAGGSPRRARPREPPRRSAGCGTASTAPPSHRSRSRRDDGRAAAGGLGRRSSCRSGRTESPGSGRRSPRRGRGRRPGGAARRPARWRRSAAWDRGGSRPPGSPEGRGRCGPGRFPDRPRRLRNRCAPVRRSPVPSPGPPTDRASAGCGRCFGGAPRSRGVRGTRRWSRPRTRSGARPSGGAPPARPDRRLSGRCRRRRSMGGS